jgi:predicted Zn-dependent protease
MCIRDSPHIGRLAGEAWLRAGEASQAIAPLTQALGYADDLRVKRALGLAYVLAGQPAEGVPLLAAYLDAVPEDESALLAGLYGVYAQHAVAPRHERLAGDLTRAKAWARTYARLDGVMSPLATVWVEYLDSLR